MTTEDLGAIPLQIKVRPEETDGALFVLTRRHGKAGPPPHFHYEQDEWVLRDEGTSPSRSATRGSRWAPRFTFAPAWCRRLGVRRRGPGHAALAVQPAGSLEAFFRQVAR